MKNRSKFIFAIMFLFILTSCKPVSLLEEPETVEQNQETKDSRQVFIIDDNNIPEADAQDYIFFKEAMNELFKDRHRAIETKDYDLYMSGITLNNDYFFNEQERWFMGMTHDTIQDVSFEILSTELVDRNTGIVNIRQRHKTHNFYDIEYPLLFKKEDGQWKDYGYNFEILETERFTVKYMKNELRVEEFRQLLDDAYDHLEEIYVEKPHENFEMKLFHDQEMLRQRTIPANGWLFTGWSEPDESLKIFTGHPSSYKGYPGVVQHELVHHITIRICNNNLAVWLLEGIAMHDGSAYYGFENSNTLRELSKVGVSNTIEDLENLDLGGNISRQEIVDFYNTSFMYVTYIRETYGRDTLMEVFYEAGKKPFHDSTLNDSFEKNNQITTEEVINYVLGISKKELSEDYLNWLEETDFFDSL